MKDNFKIKKATINNYNTHNGRVGDSYLVITGAGGAVIVLAGGVVWLICSGVMAAVDKLELMVLVLSRRFAVISETVSAPGLKWYFIAMLCLCAVIAIGGVYLWNRFKITQLFAKFFNNEEDKDWNDIL